MLSVHHIQMDEKQTEVLNILILVRFRFGLLQRLVKATARDASFPLLALLLPLNLTKSRCRRERWKL